MSCEHARLEGFAEGVKALARVWSPSEVGAQRGTQRIGGAAGGGGEGPRREHAQEVEQHARALEDLRIADGRGKKLAAELEERVGEHVSVSCRDRHLLHQELEGEHRRREVDQDGTEEPEH